MTSRCWSGAPFNSLSLKSSLINKIGPVLHVLYLCTWSGPFLWPKFISTKYIVHYPSLVSFVFFFLISFQSNFPSLHLRCMPHLSLLCFTVPLATIPNISLSYFVNCLVLSYRTNHWRIVLFHVVCVYIPRTKNNEIPVLWFNTLKLWCTLWLESISSHLSNF